MELLGSGDGLDNIEMFGESPRDIIWGKHLTLA